MSNSSKIPEAILDDLSSRFIINIPKHERTGLNRISFQIEIAHWFYLDYYCAQNPELRPYKLKEFFYYIFRHIPFLKRYEANLDSIYSEWRDYKLQVPTFGAVLMDDTMSNILLVQSYMASSWGFPKGKINQEEDPVDCACREVFEETGINISKLIKPNEYVESVIHDQLIRLYFIVGIDKNVLFRPQNKGEIKAFKWFAVDQLPLAKKDASLVSKTRLPDAKFFYMVAPFMKRILCWIDDRKRRPTNNKIRKNERVHNTVSVEINQHSPNYKNKKPQVQMEKPQKSNLPDRIMNSGNYLKNEILAAKELQQSFENSSPDLKSSRASKKKIRDFRRALNRKIRPDNYLDLKTQLENGSQAWKNFHFNKDEIMKHFYS